MTRAGGPDPRAVAETAYDRRKALLDASPEWRFRIAVERFERSVRNVEAHIHKHGSAPMPDALWAEGEIARRELMALDPAASESRAADAEARAEAAERRVGELEAELEVHHSRLDPCHHCGMDADLVQRGGCGWAGDPPAMCCRALRREPPT